jgi:hypothetical protein
MIERLFQRQTVFVLGFRLTQQGSVLALLARYLLLEKVPAVPLYLRFHLPLVGLFVYSSFLLQRVLRRKKIVDPPHACVFA